MLIEDSKKNHKDHEAAMGYWPGAFDETNDDTKRHFEMLKTAIPIVRDIKPQTILTIGDNRGRDAAFFKKIIGCHSIASDLDISKLLPAKAEGFIDDCKIIDVEKIGYPDDSIDLVIVKETFHHWPRPMLGFYEILRVAKYGVVLIEPFDCYHGQKIKSYVDPNDYSDNYEEVGNYLYKISLREILKACWSLYLDKVLAVGFNDPYSAPFVYDDWMIEKYRLDQLGKKGDRQFNLMTIFIEKQKGKLSGDDLGDYEVYLRPKNLYLEKESQK
jgi:SAM-dependent methyltransferase